LLKNSAPEKTRIQERSLEGGDVPVERIQRPRQVRRASVQRTIPSGDGAVSPETISGSQTPQLSRPSPFGPRGADASSPTSATEGISAGTSGTSEGQSGSVNESPINSQGQSPLPGGRPSPFGPRE
jgi:hypothetical protein